jgi:hypothetical protein
VLVRNAFRPHNIEYAAHRARGDDPGASAIRDALSAHPHAGVLLRLFRIIDSPAGSAQVCRDCIAALEAHPEIRSWP